jgi:hypothetical protein
MAQVENHAAVGEKTNFRAMRKRPRAALSRHDRQEMEHSLGSNLAVFGLKLRRESDPLEDALR